MNMTFEKFHECFAALKIFDANVTEGEQLGSFLILKGVRSFTKWTLAPLKAINILTGPNSSGKSTLLDLISSLDRHSFEDKIKNIAESSNASTFVGFSVDFDSVAQNNDHPEWFDSSIEYSFLQKVSEEFNKNSVSKNLKDKRITLIAESKGKEWPFDIYVFLNNRCIAFTRIDHDPADMVPKQYLKIAEGFWQMQYTEKFSDELSDQLSLLPYVKKPKIKLNFELAGTDLVKSKLILFELSEGRTPYLKYGPVIQFNEYMPDPEVVSYALICIYVIFIKPFLVIEKFSGTILPGIRPVSTPKQLTFHFQANRKLDGSVSNIEEISTDTAEAFTKIAKTIAANQIGLHSFLYGKKLIKEINNWMFKILGESHKLSFRTQVNKLESKKHPWSKLSNWRGMHYIECKVEFLIIDKSRRELNLSDVGTGVSQLLPVISSIIGGENNLYSQPELHLHPKAQAILGDLFVFGMHRNREIHNKHRGIPIHSVSLETHSEHLILRILRRINETHIKSSTNSITNKDLSVMYVNPTHNFSSLHCIRVDESGEFLDVWPNGFFVDRFEDIFFQSNE
jgi:predicted ATPase